MPKIVILGSCRHAPYEILLTPNPFDKELYVKDHEKAYEEACKHFYPAIDKADIVLVYTPNGKIGEHTQRDIDYARTQGKIIFMITPNKECVECPDLESKKCEPCVPHETERYSPCECCPHVKKMLDDLRKMNEAEKVKTVVIRPAFIAGEPTSFGVKTETEK